MARASIRDLRYHFDKVEAQLVRGESVEITRRGRVVAQLSPPKPAENVSRRPDFMARLKEMWGDRILPPTVDLLDEIRRDKI